MDASYTVQAAFTDEDGVAVIPNMNSYADTFTQAFTSDTGFTYTASEAEFTGGMVQQKDQRPTDATFYVPYTSDLDGAWGGGVLTGTATGGASVSGGKLDLDGGTLQYVTYSATGNAASTQTGCIRFDVTPAYSGSPASDRSMIIISTGATGLVNAVWIYHSSAGNLTYSLYNSAGASIASAVASAWSPTATTEYEIEINWDITTGANRIFVDGTQLGATNVNTGTRTAGDTIKVGTNGLNSMSPDFKIDNLVVFSTVQHTANYTPGDAPYSYIYKATNVDLPDFEVDTGDGTLDLLAYTAFTAISVGCSGIPKYTLEGKYWNGSAWVTSDDTYAQANTAAEVNTNIASLTAGNTTSVTIHFQDSNTQSCVDNLEIDYTAESYGAFWALTDSLGNVINSRTVQPLTEASTVNIAMSGDDLARQSVTDTSIRYLTITGNYDSSYGTALAINAVHTFSITDLQQPVDVEKAKTHLRVTSNDEDIYISRLVTEATEQVEQYVLRKLMQQTVVEYFDFFPSAFELKWSPIVSATTIKYTNSSGTQTTLASDQYILDQGNDFERGSIVPAYNVTWPTTTLYPVNPIEVTYIAGYGTSSGDVPQMLQVGILQYIEHLYSYRGPEITGQTSKKIWHLDAILMPHVIRHFQ
jgi:uncharacterized phiE125 gp8 family phage protein